MQHDTFESVLATLTPDLVANLKRAVELGKWPDGRRLSDEQKKICLEAVFVWEMQHLPVEERTGYIHKATKKEGDTCSSTHEQEVEQQVKFLY